MLDKMTGTVAYAVVRTGGFLKADIHHSMVTQSVSNLIAAGLLQPLNRSYLTNFGNVIPTFNDPWYDKGAAYTVPYMFFGTGIGYRTDRIDPAEVEAQGWDALWNANIFHPDPLALALSEHLFGQTLQVLPVYWVTGNIILCYNLLFISTFALSGFGTYLLVQGSGSQERRLLRQLPAELAAAVERLQRGPG